MILLCSFLNCVCIRDELSKISTLITLSFGEFFNERQPKVIEPCDNEIKIRIQDWKMRSKSYFAKMKNSRAIVVRMGAKYLSARCLLEQRKRSGRQSKLGRTSIKMIDDYRGRKMESSGKPRGNSLKKLLCHLFGKFVLWLSEKLLLIINFEFQGWT